jgi:uncharacterized membrane protein YfcA
VEADSATLLLWLALGVAAFGAGVVDAVIGGGGMVQLPALFAFMPNVAPPPLLGTNKLASAIGTTGAAIQYARSMRTPWRVVAPCMLVAFVAALAGAYAVTLIPAEPLKKALPFILAALLLYTWASGAGKETLQTREKPMALASSGSGVIGFYDASASAPTPSTSCSLCAAWASASCAPRRRPSSPTWRRTSARWRRSRSLATSSGRWAFSWRRPISPAAFKDAYL